MKNNDQLASTPQGVLRGWLIEHFVNEQKATHEYLLLTADQRPSKPVPPSLVVAEQWAWLRQNAGTIPEEVQKAEIDLMYAVSAGEFPELLMMNRTTSVELLFDRSLVEELAAKIGRKLEIEFDPWEAENKNTEPGAVTKNTAEMTTEKCANMRPRDLGLPGNHYLSVVDRFRGALWAPRAAVTKFLEGRGIAAELMPPSWQTHKELENDLPGSADLKQLEKAYSLRVKNLPGDDTNAVAASVARLKPGAKPISSGRRAMKRAIETAFLKNFPSRSIPPGMSSQERDEKIYETVKGIIGRKPNIRTIQRALKELCD